MSDDVMSLPITLVYSLSWVFNDPAGRLQGALLFPCIIVLLLLTHLIGTTLLSLVLVALMWVGIGYTWFDVTPLSLSMLGGFFILRFAFLLRSGGSSHPWEPLLWFLHRSSARC